MGGMPFAGIPRKARWGAAGLPEGSGRFFSARRPARLSTLRRAGRRCGCRAGMGGGMSAVQTTQLTANWPQLTILRTRLSRSE